MFEDYTQQKTTNTRLPSRLTVFTHKPPINLCAREKAKIAPVFKLCASVKWEKKKYRTLLSEKRGGHGAGQRVQQKEKKKNTSPVIACHQTENCDSKCGIEGGYSRAYCKPVKDARTIHLPRNLGENQKGEAKGWWLVVGGGWRFQSYADSLELDVTHTKQ